ncbi:MAG: long-chain fatty acid--CoA ligase [Chloroflexota bacterium]
MNVNDQIPAPRWLERLAGLWPTRVAVIDPDTGVTYTYSDLHVRAISVAAALQDAGIVAGDRVCALMHNGVPLLDLLFGCGHLGAILVPVNWRLSDREIARVLHDSDPSVLVAEAGFTDVAGRIAPDKVSTVQMSALYASPRQALDVTTQMQSPWIILYTGGTTGAPKGAVLTHGSVIWNAVNTAVSWGLSQHDVAPNFTPMFHTGGLNVFTLPILMLGGRVILPRQFDPCQALEILEKHSPTVLFMVPTMFQLVADQPGFDAATFPALRWAISGGAPCPERVYTAWKPKVPFFKQGYGLTEVGPNNFATPDDDAVRKQGTVGRLTFLARARIVDETGKDLAAGQAGELLLAGPHMCAGYWRQPEATANAIRDGWFHTGDIARRDDEDFYYIVDRKKDMIISGGENVYPTEVEAALYESPMVREAAVIGVPDPTWGEAVVAVVALTMDKANAVDELLQHMRAHLARYKVPKQVIVVDDIPKNAAGKIMRSACMALVKPSQNEP